MTLVGQLADYIHAAFTGLWVHTLEPEEAERELLEHGRRFGWTVAVWDLARGLRLSAGATIGHPEAADPVSVLRALPTLSPPPADPEAAPPAEADTTLLLLPNFHRFLNSPEVVQVVAQQLTLGKQQRTFLVVLAPVVQIPVELERRFVVVEHPLPTASQLGQIAEEILTDSSEDGLPTGKAWDALLDSAAGLTRQEAEGAFALSLVRHDELRPEAIWEIKAQSLKKQNLLSLYRGGETFAQLGGLDALKDFCRRALQPGRSVRARGALLLSPPGCGKSAFCRALGNEVGRPVLSLDIGRLMGSLIGDTERNVRQALQIAEAMAPSILFCDEIEKGLSGVNGTGDSGVSTRLFGSLLTWLADHESDVFFIGTANDIRRLPPEFTRAERLDGIFFVDLPTAEQRRAIWQLYRKHYDIGPAEPIPADDGWTGAEIKSCCRLSALLNVSLTEAARNVVPVSITSAEAINQLRDWASGRCLSADRPGIYQKTPSTAARRKLAKPSAN